MIRYTNAPPCFYTPPTAASTAIVKLNEAVVFPGAAQKVAVVGPRGYGKTELVNYWVHAVRHFDAVVWVNVAGAKPGHWEYRYCEALSAVYLDGEQPTSDTLVIFDGADGHYMPGPWVKFPIVMTSRCIPAIPVSVIRVDALSDDYVAQQLVKQRPDIPLSLLNQLVQCIQGNLYVLDTSCAALASPFYTPEMIIEGIADSDALAWADKYHETFL